jgi:hypothetical protein
MPGVSLAQGIVECFTNCGFNELINLINKVINWLLFVVSLPLAAIIFTYAGFLLLFSGGDHHKVDTAKAIFKNVVFGLVLACAAWLIVHTILSTLGYNGSWIGF